MRKRTRKHTELLDPFGIDFLIIVGEQDPITRVRIYGSVPSTRQAASILVEMPDGQIIG